MKPVAEIAIVDLAEPADAAQWTDAAFVADILQKLFEHRRKHQPHFLQRSPAAIVLHDKFLKSGIRQHVGQLVLDDRQKLPRLVFCEIEQQFPGTFNQLIQRNIVLVEQNPHRVTGVIQRGQIRSLSRRQIQNKIVFDDVQRHRLRPGNQVANLQKSVEHKRLLPILVDPLGGVAKRNLSRGRAQNRRSGELRRHILALQKLSPTGEQQHFDKR